MNEAWDFALVTKSPPALPACLVSTKRAEIGPGFFVYEVEVILPHGRRGLKKKAVPFFFFLSVLQPVHALKTD